MEPYGLATGWHRSDVDGAGMERGEQSIYKRHVNESLGTDSEHPHPETYIVLKYKVQ